MFRKEPLEFLRQVLFVVFVYEVFRCGFKKSVANTVQFIKKSLRILFVREKDHPHSHSVTNPVRVLPIRAASYRLRADSCAI